MEVLADVFAIQAMLVASSLACAACARIFRERQGLRSGFIGFVALSGFASLVGAVVQANFIQAAVEAFVAPVAIAVILWAAMMASSLNPPLEGQKRGE